MNPFKLWLYGGLGIAAIMLSDEFDRKKPASPQPSDQPSNGHHERDLQRFEYEGGPSLPTE